MDEELRRIRATVWKYIGLLTGGIILLWLILYALTYNYKPWISKTKSSDVVWENPRNAETVTYPTYRDPEENAPPRKTYNNNKSFKGVIITTRDGRVIETGLTYEELFEQLNLEYEDLYEYYMD